MAAPWYATREDVKTALNYNETARNNRQIDRALATATTAVDRLCQRQSFAPATATRYFDWPTFDRGASGYAIELDADEIISVTSITAGGTVVDDYFLEPANDGPPYDRIEVDLSTSDRFAAGTTWQRAIVVVGLFGYADDEESATTLDGALSDTTGTTVTVDATADIGVGSLLKVDSERMLVTARALVDTTENTTGALTASQADQSLDVDDGTVFAVDETVMVDSEKLRVVEIAGNTLTVDRAYDGSTLATHSSGADVYAYRQLTVERGAQGSTAATHSDAATVYRWTPPDLVHQACVAEAINTIQQEASGYSRRVGLSETRGLGKRGLPRVGDSGLTDLRTQLFGRHGRIRTGAV